MVGLVYVERSGTAAPRRCRVHKRGASRIFSAGHGGQKHLHRRCIETESLEFKHARKSDIASLHKCFILFLLVVVVLLCFVLQRVFRMVRNCRQFGVVRVIVMSSMS